jgi:hypothetical protein
MTDVSKFEVGISAVVVPDGIEYDRKTRFCRVSISLSPVDSASSRSIGTADIRMWPAHIAHLTEFITAQVQVEGRETATVKPDAKSQLRLRSFSDKATCLWQRIFTDGADSSNAGFYSLAAALRKERTLSAFDKAPATSSPTAQLARAIDGMSASAIATSLIQRSAAKVLSESGRLTPAHQAILQEACAPSLNWWATLHGDQLISELRKESALKIEEPRSKNRIDSVQDGPEYFTKEIANPNFWRRGHIHRAAHSAPALHAFRLAHLKHLSFLRVDAQTQGTDPNHVSPEEIAQQKYAGILCLPTLAKYLGLIIDIRVEASLLSGAGSPSRSMGQISVALAHPDSSTRAQVASKPPHVPNCGFLQSNEVVSPSISSSKEATWTAYVMRSTELYEYFGPAERGELAGAGSKPGADGLLRLGEMNGAQPRFQLCTLDVTNAAERILARVSDSNTKKVLDETKSFPELLTRGIALRDTLRERKENEATDLRIKKEAIAKDPNARKVLYSEDLVVGYEIDVALISKSAKGSKGRPKSERWRTLMARTVHHGRDIDSAFYQEPSVRKQHERDDGHVKLMVRIPGDGALKREVHEEFFTWTGESLAIPHIESAIMPKLAKGQKNTIGKNEIGICPRSLTVDTVYDLPKENEESYRKPPPLREGREYMFGARVRYLNGCTLSFHNAVKRYTSGEEGLLIGEDSQRPFEYLRRNAIHAPELLLPWNSRLVSSHDCKTLAKDAPGETIAELVIRSGDFETETSVRFLVPPRVTFDLAEQAGLFDNDYSSRPTGAFRGRIKTQLDNRSGAFATARGGTWVFPSSSRNQKPSTSCKEDMQTVESRGSVFLLDSNAKRPDIDFYPDPLARQAYARFVPPPRPAALLDDGLSTPSVDDGLSMTNFEDKSHGVEFWSSKETALAAEPIILSLKKARREPKGLLGWFDRTDRNATVPEVRNRSMVHLKKLSVALAPGASVYLELFSVPTCKGTEKHHALAKSIELLRHPDVKGQLATASFGISSADVNNFHRTLAELTTVGDSQDELCENLLSQGPLSQVTTKRLVKLVHAVDCPISPRFLAVDGKAITGSPSTSVAQKSSDNPSLGVLRLFPINIAAPKNLQNNVASGQREESHETTDESVPRNLDTANEKTSLQKRWQAYVETNESWKEFLDNQQRLSVPSPDHNCNWRDKGTAISDDEKKLPRLERRCWQGEEGGVTTFFAGEVLVDRLTTGRLRCEARWFEYSPAIVRRNGVHGAWVADAPTRFAKLFQIDQLEVEDRRPGFAEKIGGLDKVDLLRNPSNNLRNLAYPFADGRARKLFLQLIATTRFTNYFPPGKTREGMTHELCETQAAVWLSSTFRPAPPEIDRILPLFKWSLNVHDGGQEIRWKRESSLRVYMGRNWFSSGEGEKLGLVCWPNNLFGASRAEEAAAAPKVSRQGLDELDPTLKPTAKDSSEHPFRKYGQYITRWGADPIRLSGALDAVMSSDRFEPGFSEKVTKTLYNEDLLLWLPDSNQEFDSTSSSNARIGGADKAPSPLSVCLLAYDVHFETTEGTWYSDITVDHGAAYFPFVQLGLVRYQAHAGKGLELSFPVAAFAQIPPRREGYVRFLGDREFYLEVSGIGYHQSEIGDCFDAKRDKGDFPHLDIKLLKSECCSGENNVGVSPPNWQPVLDAKGKPIEWIDEIPQERGAELVWSKTVWLPKHEHRYAILIEEYEYMAMDAPVAGSQSNCPSPGGMFTTNLVRKGPLFSHLVDVTPPKSLKQNSKYAPDDPRQESRKEQLTESELEFIERS